MVNFVFNPASGILYELGIRLKEKHERSLPIGSWVQSIKIKIVKDESDKYVWQFSLYGTFFSQDTADLQDHYCIDIPPDNYKDCLRRYAQLRMRTGRDCVQEYATLKNSFDEIYKVIPTYTTTLF